MNLYTNNRIEILKASLTGKLFLKWESIGQCEGELVSDLGIIMKFYVCMSEVFWTKGKVQMTA
jgi:hypothetical protein